MPDWELLRALLKPGEGYRHKMGLRRLEADAFYRDTAEHGAIMAAKRAVLDDAPEVYRAVSAEGALAAAEFAEMGGLAGLPASGDMPEFSRGLSLALEPDLMIVTPPDWRLRWASICFPTRWSLEGKLGVPLPAIHAVVPELNAALEKNITTFFARLPANEGWRRANWGLTSSPALNQHPSVPLAPLTADTPREGIWIRLEDQHLLKLPRTGAIAFGIRIANYPLGEAWQEEALRNGLRDQLATMPAEIAAYKGVAAVRLS